MHPSLVKEPDKLPVVSGDPTAGDSPWARLRRFTSARIALGRTGGSQTTATVLDFRLSHARARDAVHSVFVPEKIRADLSAAGIASELIHSAAASREEYLLRPDLGRRLREDSTQTLQTRAVEWGRRDLAIIISDGLAAQAAMHHAVPTVLPLIATLEGLGWSLCPVLVVPFGRVKLQDEIGLHLGVGLTLMLLGERPGLGAPDSLGAYFTFGPGPQRTDADRNCLSNIRPEGLPPAAAAAKLATLLYRAKQLQGTGVHLKDEDELIAGASMASLAAAGGAD